MKTLIGRLGAVAAGALAMYYLDPQMGRERRAAFAELLRGGIRRQQATVRAQRARRQRAYERVPRADPQTDAQVRDTVRERVGRLLSHPGAVDVTVQDGLVRLSGRVLGAERDALLQEVHRMPGVQKLVSALTVSDDPAEVTGAAHSLSTAA